MARRMLDEHDNIARTGRYLLCKISYYENNILEFSANAGIKIAGAYSRGWDQKSLALFARGEYGVGEFEHPFFDNLDYDKIFSLPLDDNLIYVNDVNYSHSHLECSIDDSIIYCGSFVLWFLGNHHRNNQSLFADIRSHRIFPKNIWEALDEL